MKKFYYGKPDGYIAVYRKEGTDIFAQWYDMRIEEKSVPEDKFMYECADYDGTGDICRIQPHIMVDFFGTIVTDVPLSFDGPLDESGKNRINLSYDDCICWIDEEEYSYGKQKVS